MINAQTTERNVPASELPRRLYVKPQVIYRAPLEATAGVCTRNYDADPCTLFGKAEGTLTCTLLSS